MSLEAPTAWVRDWEAEAAPALAETLRRVKIVHDIGLNSHKRQAARIACAESLDTFADDWVWTFDPRCKPPLPKRLPMVLWPRQREFLSWAKERVDTSQKGLAKKSRDLGVTWIICILATWLWLFQAETTIKFGSRKEQLVDRKGDPDAIFWKIRFILDNLPKWMLPAGFAVGGPYDNYMRIVNPQNGSTIMGEAGDNMGRGGRATCYFIDEFSTVPRASGVWASVVDNADTVLIYSTSAGPGTMFFRLEMGGAIPVFRFHYSDDPRKGPGWRERAVKLLGPADFAREHEMDDHAALDNQICPGPWIAAAIQWDAPAGLAPRVAGLDPADTGTDETCYCARVGHEVIRLVSWSDALDADAFRRIAALTVEDRCEGLNYDRVGVGAGVAGAMALQGSPFAVRGIANGERVPAHWVFDDDPDRPAVERFADIATALWWNLRLRLERTFEHVNGIAKHEPSTMISLPQDAHLVAQLASRKYVVSGDRVRLESKGSMSKRGVQSPDRAEAVAYAFAPAASRKRGKTGGVFERRSRAKGVFNQGW